MKMRKVVLYNLLCILALAYSVCDSLGQTNKIVPPTPNAMKMTEYNAQRPNMYTGTANVTIPLYTINFDGMSLPLSISYNATGIRTNEEASEVGLGWALNATGVISRTIKAGDDLFKGTLTNSKKGYVYNTFPVVNDETEMGYTNGTAYVPPVGSYYRHLAVNREDTQPDIFNYNFFGYSGSFVLSQKVVDPTGPVKAIKITQDACSILFDEDLRTFKIITPNGYVGEFTVEEKSTTFSSLPVLTNNRMNCFNLNNYDIAERINDDGSLRATTSWLLSKITSPNGQTIVFEYDYSSQIYPVEPQNAYLLPYPTGVPFSRYISNSRAFAEVPIEFSGENSTGGFGSLGISGGTAGGPFSGGGNDIPGSYIVVQGKTEKKEDQPSGGGSAGNGSVEGGSLGGASPGPSDPIGLQTIHEHVYLKSINSDQVRIDFLMETREDLRQNYFFAPDSSMGAGNVFHKSENLKRYSGITIKGLDPSSTLNKSIVIKQSYFNQHYHDPFANNQNERELRWLRSRLDRLTIDDQEYQFYYEDGLPNKLTNGIDHFGFYNGKDKNGGLYPPIMENPNCDLATSDLVTYYRQNNDRVADFAFGKAALLKKVVYPTRGHSLFEYEPHTYLPDATGKFIEGGPGSSVSAGKAGGARIRSIKEYDFGNLTPAKTRTYVYGEFPQLTPVGQGASTGKLMTPLLSRYKKILHNAPQGTTDYYVIGCNYLFESNSNIPGSSSAEGKIIGYSKVHEIVTGTSDSYTNTYYFENRPNIVSDWNLTVNGFPNLNGQVILINNYDSQGKLVQQVKNQDIEHNLGNINALVYTLPPTNGWFFPYAFSPITKSFNTPYTVITTTSATPSGIVEDASGNISGTFLQTRKDVAYNSSYLLRSESITSSKGETILTLNNRPSDYAIGTGVIGLMKDKNIVEPVIEQIISRNGQVVSATGNLYAISQNGNRVDLASSYEYNKDLGAFSSSSGTAFVSPYEKKVDFTSYDPISGKLLEYKGTDGVVHSFIWGYVNNSLPIVHGVGLGKDPLNTAHVAATGSADYETALRNHANTLGKQITTYTHNPLVGISKITDPSGFKQTYEYDPYSRLKKVLDKDGKTTEQYDYHFMERMPTRILSVAGDMNFGTLTPDMFAAQFTPYVRCSDNLRSRTFTLTNTGEDDLTVGSVYIQDPLVASAFDISWQSGVITPGTSISVVVTFKGESASISSYNSTLSIISNRTNTESVDTPITANFTNRICSLLPSPTTGTTPKIFDFGTVTGALYGSILSIKNEGNAPFRLLALALDWDGIATTYVSTNADFSVSLPVGGICLGVGETASITVNFNPQPGPNGVRSTKLSLITDIDPAICTVLENIVTLQGNIQRIQSTITMDTSPVDFGTFTEAFKTKTITISNNSTLGFTINGISVADGTVASWFTLTPSTWTLDPGTTKDFVLTFQPAVKDQTVNTTITVNNDAQYGNETFEVTGRRYSLRKMILSTEPSNLLVFDNTNETKPVTITNASISNDNLSVMDVSPLNASLLGWAVTSFTPSVLVPGESMTMQIMRTGVTAPDQTITIGSSKNDGVNSFTLKSGITRVIGLTTLPSTTLPAFSTPSISQNITVSNSGTGTLSVGGITSTNPMFSVSPNTVIVAPNSQQTVTVTFTPTAFNFSQQTTTLTFTSDATGGTSSINIIGQRTSIKNIQLSPNALVFDPPLFVPKNVTVTNIGNDNLSITGVSNPNTHDWNATITPVTLAPNQSTTLSIFQKTPVPSPATTNISVTSDKNVGTGNEIVQVSANIRLISISSLTFPSFTAASVTQNMTVTNSSTSTLPLTINSITSSNGKFTMSPTSFTLSPGASQAVAVTYTPTDFTLQSTTLTINSNSSNGGFNTVSTSAQRAQLAQLNPLTASLNVKFSNQTPYSIITNTGNVPVTINSIGTLSNVTPPNSFNIAYELYSVATWVPITFPTTIQPLGQIRIVASTSQSGIFSTASAQLNVNTTNAGTITINLTRSTF